jgi:hypothetical protein
MPIQTRYAGDALGINNVDSSYTAAGGIVATGLTKAPIALKVLLGNSQNFGTAECATGGSVETILRQMTIDGTIVMYQVETTGGQLSVLLEATGAGNTAATAATTIQSRLQAIAGNIGVSANVWMGGGVTVTTSGFKLA